MFKCAQPQTLSPVRRKVHASLLAGI
jgi:hypothetical protein